MNNFIILTPSFNDWKSLSKLLFEIDKNITGLKGNFRTLVINDASTLKPKLNLKNVKHLRKIKIITLKKILFNCYSFNSATVFSELFSAHSFAVWF